MQTPHDPEVTYSGHKGKGYEVQVAETCEEGNAVQVITHVEVTPSSGNDAGVTVGVIDDVERARDRSFGAVVRHVVWFWTERMGGRAQRDGAGEPCRGPGAGGGRQRMMG